MKRKATQRSRIQRPVVTAADAQDIQNKIARRKQRVMDERAKQKPAIQELSRRNILRGNPASRQILSGQPTNMGRLPRLAQSASQVTGTTLVRSGSIPDGHTLMRNS